MAVSFMVYKHDPFTGLNGVQDNGRAAAADGDLGKSAAASL